MAIVTSVVEQPTQHRISYVTGQRGLPKLVYNGYSFVRNKGNATATYWRCSMLRSQRCPARIVTQVASNDVCVKRAIHTHGPDYEEYALGGDVIGW